MELLGLAAALLCNTSLAVIDKECGTRLESKSAVLPFSFCKTLLCALFALLLLLFGEHSITSLGVAVSLGAGIFHALSVVLIMHCLRTSPAVYVNLFMASGILLPTLFDWIFTYNRVIISQLIFLVCIVFSLSLVLGFKKGKSNIKLLAVMFLCYGMLMVMQRSFPKLCPSGSNALFSAVMYSSSAVILGALCLIRRSRVRFTPRLSALCVTASTLNLAINLLLTSLSASLPSSTVFPVVHGLKMVAVTMLSSLLWKEKLSSKQIVGAFLTIIFVCLIGG